MHTGFFKAGTQYGDWDGTAAADEYGANHTFEELFEATGKVDKDKELLIAFEIYAGERGFFTLTGYFHDKSDSTDLGWVPSLNQDFSKDTGKIQVRQVDLQITLEEFFMHFKRFNVVMVRNGLDIIGREYEASETEEQE